MFLIWGTIWVLGLGAPDHVFSHACKWARDIQDYGTILVQQNYSKDQVNVSVSVVCRPICNYKLEDMDIPTAVNSIASLAVGNSLLIFNTDYISYHSQLLYQLYPYRKFTMITLWKCYVINNFCPPTSVIDQPPIQISIHDYRLNWICQYKIITF